MEPPCGSFHVSLVSATCSSSWSPNGCTADSKVQRQKSGLFVVPLFKREDSAQKTSGLSGQNRHGCPVLCQPLLRTMGSRDWPRDSSAGRSPPPPAPAPDSQTRTKCGGQLVAHCTRGVGGGGQSLPGPATRGSAWRNRSRSLFPPFPSQGAYGLFKGGKECPLEGYPGRWHSLASAFQDFSRWLPKLNSSHGLVGVSPRL